MTEEQEKEMETDFRDLLKTIQGYYGMGTDELKTYWLVKNGETLFKKILDFQKKFIGILPLHFVKRYPVLVKLWGLL